jgi:hypothetical protein
MLSITLTRLQRAIVGGAVLVALLVAPQAASAALITLHATIEGVQEVPPTTSNATGDAVMSYDTATHLFDLAIVGNGINLADLLGAHIHQAPPGANGPVVVDLNAASFFGGMGLFGRAINAAPFPVASEAALLAGDTYINLHTTLFPAGEIRGQLIPAVPEPTGLVLVAGVVVWLGCRRWAA